MMTDKKDLKEFICEHEEQGGEEYLELSCRQGKRDSDLPNHDCSDIPI